jgi:hypothetical protein
LRPERNSKRQRNVDPEDATDEKQAESAPALSPEEPDAKR